MNAPFTLEMIQQAEEIKNTRDHGYVGARISEIAPGGWFKGSTETTKGTAIEVTVDCEHDTSIGCVVRWYWDGTRIVRFEQFHTISRAEAEIAIQAAVDTSIAAENDAVQRNEQRAGA